VKRPDADGIIEGRLTEHEIPALPWPEVGRREREHCHGIRRLVLRQEFKDEPG
jgi:hypothetical protein